jgi:uncharacterized protein YkwD
MPIQHEMSGSGAGDGIVRGAGVGRGGRGARRRGFFVALIVTAGLLALTMLVSSASMSTPVLTTTTTVKPTTTTVKPPPDACTTARNDVQREINLVRAWFHVPLLHQQSGLTGAAQAHVRYMNSVGSVSHGPGGNPPLWVQEIIDKGYKPYSKLGQNLGGGMNNAHDLVSAWINSKSGHLQTMIDRDFSQLGTGCYHNTSGKGWPWYWAVDFGRP